MPSATEESENEIAQRGKDLRRVTGTHAAGILAEGHIADEVQAILD